MKIESNIAQLPKKAGSVPTSGVTFKHPVNSPQDAVRFGADSVVDEANEVKRVVLGGGKRELLGPEIFQGYMPLAALSKVEVHLPKDKAIAMQAYQELLRIGLRFTNLPKADEEAFQKRLDNPSPELKEAMNTWFKTLGITAETLKTPVVDAHEIDRINTIPRDMMLRMKDLGLYRLKVPKDYGGLGFSQREYSKVLEVFPEVSSTLGTLVSAHSTIGSAPLMLYGTEDQKKKYLTEISKGDYLAAFGLTEPFAGTDTGRAKVTASLSDDGKNWLVSGHKLYITNTINSGVMYLVAGETKIPGKAWPSGKDKGNQTVLIVDLPFRVADTPAEKRQKIQDMRKQGMIITPFDGDLLEMTTIRGSNQAFIELKNFKVPVDSVLGPKTEPNKDGSPLVKKVMGKDVTLDKFDMAGVGRGKDVYFNALNKGRLGFGPYVTAAASWAADRTVEHAIDRKMFNMYAPRGPEGKPVDGELAHQKRTRSIIGDMYVKVEQLKAVSELLAGLVDSDPKAGAASISAALKVRASEYGKVLVDKATELQGGYGLMRHAPNYMELALRDSMIPWVVEGVNPAMGPFALLTSGKAVKVPNAILGMLTGWSKGDLPLHQSLWMQTATKLFASKMGFNLATKGEGKMGKEQNLLMDSYNVFMDLITLSAVWLKLQKEKDIPAHRRQALNVAALALRKQITDGLRSIPPSSPISIGINILGTQLLGLNTFGYGSVRAVEKAMVKVGDGYISEARKNPSRPNTQDQMFAFLKSRQAINEARLDAQFGTDAPELPEAPQH